MEHENNPNRVQLPPFAPMIMERNQQLLAHDTVLSTPPASNAVNPVASTSINALHSTISPGSSSTSVIPNSSGSTAPSQSLLSASTTPLPLPSLDNKITKTGANRLRVKRACDRCKKQKTKCDGDFPCFGCSRHGHQCTYSEPKAAEKSSPDSITGTNHSSPRKKNDNESSSPYVKYLENRVRELENSVNYCKNDEVSLGEAFFKNQYTFSKDKYRVMKRYQNILPFQLAVMTKNALSPEEFKGLIIPRIQFYGWNMSSNKWLKERKLDPMNHLIDLVHDLDLANYLLDYFMVKINPMFSIIHEKIFYDQFSKFVLDAQNEDVSQATRLYSSIAYLIFAISIRYSENDPDLPVNIKNKIHSDLEENLFEAAYDVVQKLSFEWQSFELIQSWILITLYLRTTHRQNSSYMTLGTAIRMSKGMSLNLNIIPEKYSTKPYEKLKLQRIFWLVYTFDKLMSFQSGKDYEINESSIIHELPLLSNFEAVNDGWLSKPALAMIHLSKIAGEIQEYNNSHFKIETGFLRKINGDLQNWKIWFDSNSQGYDQLLIDQTYLMYHDVVLSFNNKILFKLLDKGQFSDDEGVQLKDLIRHSSYVLEIFQQIDFRLQIFVPWWQTLAILFNVSLINVFLISSGLHNQKESCSNFSIAIGLLKKLESKAQMSKECLWALKMLNHISVSRMQNSIQALTNIGIDHGPNNVNKVRFYQFGKVDDLKKLDAAGNRKRKKNQNDSTNINNNEFDLSNMEGLLSNLKWFDQWVSQFDG